MTTFTLPLPPTANHMYAPNGSRPGQHKTDVYNTWREESALAVAGWTPPERTRLAVTVRLHLPRRLYRKADLDGYCKPLIDATVGSRRDCWVDWLIVSKWLALSGDGWADVEVERMDE